MHYQEITSRDNETIKWAKKLSGSAAQRAAEGLFFAEGVRLCLDLAKTLRPRAIFFTAKVLEAHPEAASLGEENYLIMPHIAEKLSETRTPQGLFCLFPLPGYSWQALDAARGVLVCESIQDPGNIGAVLRSAAAFGFGAVVLTEGCADAFSPRVLRASVGAAARIPLYAGLTMAEAAARLKDAGATLWAAALQGAKPLGQAKPGGPFALLIGNEGAGLSAEALALADEAVYIPMHSGVESLNAAVAAGVLMYHFSVEKG